MTTTDQLCAKIKKNPVVKPVPERWCESEQLQAEQIAVGARALGNLSDEQGIDEHLSLVENANDLGRHVVAKKNKAMHTKHETGASI